MDGKKISFGFMKTKKVEKPSVEEKKEFIECVEEKSIRVLGGEDVKEHTPLVIPMKPNTLITAERLKEIAVKVESALDEPEKQELPPSPKNKPPENETLEQMAVRELLESAKKEVKVETPQLMVPLPPKSIADGEKESTLEDYESVPVQDFGIAMLRGMGWTPNNNDKSKYKLPQLRPKGLGLGADKVVKDNQKQKVSQDSKDEELTIVKNAFVKITTGKYSGYYAKVVSLDEDNGRVMVELAVKRETVSLSEFMMHPVTKTEYDKESKVINATTYEEYKKNENAGGKSTLKSEDKSSKKTEKIIQENSRYSEKESRTENYYDKESTSRVRDRGDNKREREDEKRERERDRMNRDFRDDRYKRKEISNKYSSNESLSSLSDSQKRSKKKKDKKRYSSDDSLSSQSETERKYKKKESKRYSSDSESDKKKKNAKRDIDKKRKGKKKKRDRDRSPNYRKHRK